MRLGAQMKNGFYPAHPEAVRYAAKMIQAPAPEEQVAVIDPCCGEGEALHTLCDTIGVPRQYRWGIELDDGRSDIASPTFHEGHFLGRTSFLGTGITQGAFGLAWVNPPFDDEMGGGGRVEYSFLVRATFLLRPRGVILFVCPDRVARDYKTQEYLLQWYTDICCVPFPEEHRPYDETIIAAKKRSKPVAIRDLRWHRECRHLLLEAEYAIPPSSGPRRFEKTEFTEAELVEALLKSPLRRHMGPPPDPLPAEPPLPLSTGHIALLLASGKLDGAVYPPGEPPHVVRGTVTKTQYVSEVKEEEAEGGNKKTTTIYSEKIVLRVRAVGPDGKILDFGE